GFATLGLALLAAGCGGGLKSATPTPEAIATERAPQSNTSPFANAPGTDEAASQAFAADIAQPRFTGSLAGVRFEGGAVRGADYDCGANPVLHPDFSVALGTPLDIFASGLPAGWLAGATGGTTTPDKPYTAQCGGVLIATDRNVVVSTSAGPQLVTVGRLLTPEPWTGSDFPASRASAGLLAGQPAVMVRSIMTDGRGGSSVIWADRVANGYIVTKVDGDAPLSAIEPVAEAIARQAGSGR